MVINAVDSPGHTAITCISPSTPPRSILPADSIFLFYHSLPLCLLPTVQYFFFWDDLKQQFLCLLFPLYFYLYQSVQMSLPTCTSVSDPINLSLLKSVCLSDSWPVCLRFKSIFRCLSVSGASPSVYQPPGPSVSVSRPYFALAIWLRPKSICLCSSSSVSLPLCTSLSH